MKRSHNTDYLRDTAANANCSDHILFKRFWFSQRLFQPLSAVKTNQEDERGIGNANAGKTRRASKQHRRKKMGKVFHNPSCTLSTFIEPRHIFYMPLNKIVTKCIYSGTLTYEFNLFSARNPEQTRNQWKCHVPVPSPQNTHPRKWVTLSTVYYV